ncbi:hypothetical protein H0R92_09670 [Treponema sp. OMZ 840]|uniref:hypothetical protein n=1 Tax=Treponema sp. OMZ 840 TaxID=244313 RepID=UPI003D8AD68A
MQAIMETVFDFTYLPTVITLGIIMIKKSKGQKQFLLYGLMAVGLGFGDAFHLIPRSIALLTTGLENHAVSLGIGKWITSITMTIFYVLLYHVWQERYGVFEKKNLTAFMYILAVLRIGLCFMPQNAWTSPDAPLSWAIYRNIPFTVMGIIIIVLFYKSAKEKKDGTFRRLWLTIVLSFGFYIPVVLFSDAIPLVGILMIPKTCAYVWTVVIGFQAVKNNDVGYAKSINA